ncbi:g5328 [Coccomyxa elongata]
MKDLPFVSERMRFLPVTLLFLIVLIPTALVAMSRTLQIYASRLDGQTAPVLCPSAQASDIKTVNIVYSLCGNKRKEELLRSIHSLLHLTNAVRTPEKDVQQVIYLDMDTLWMDVPIKLDQEFGNMENKQALFAMALETTDKNSKASWYKKGLSRDLPFYEISERRQA